MSSNRLLKTVDVQRLKMKVTKVSVSLWMDWPVCPAMAYRSPTSMINVLKTRRIYLFQKMKMKLHGSARLK